MLSDWVRINLFCSFCGRKNNKDWQTHDLIGGMFTLTPEEIIKILNDRENNKTIEIHTVCSHCGNKLSLNFTAESLDRCCKSTTAGHKQPHAMLGNGRLVCDDGCNTCIKIKQVCDSGLSK